MRNPRGCVAVVLIGAAWWVLMLWAVWELR